jgi:dTDP-4-amino-4,6-dideoxygalactose transaminase
LRVPLLDLQKQWAEIQADVRRAVDRVWESQRFIMGPEVSGLEEEIAVYCRCAHAVGLSSGTDALLCAMMALGIGPGDEVITSPFTFFATGGCIRRLGAKPVFVDIDPRTYNLDPRHIERAATSHTKAIVPVHLFGQCAEMDPILAVAAKHHWPVIEDAAQAIGATYKGRRAGSMGTVGCFSFFPSKNLGGAGDGGMCTLNHPELAQRLVTLRDHGQKPQYVHALVGGNFRLDAIQAAVLRVKLLKLEEWHQRRRDNAAAYNRLLADLPLVRPTVAEDNVSVYNQYVIRAPRRDALREHLTRADIGSAIYYPIPLHRQECFADLGYGQGDLPQAEKAATEVLALPVYPELTAQQIEYVADTIREFYASG